MLQGEIAMRRPCPSSPATSACLGLLGLVLCAAARPVLAHHSFAMYDSSKTVTFKATVKSFQWTNPHVIVWLNTEQPGADPQLWSVEVSSPGAMTRAGWTRRSLQPGDKVMVELSPLRDGNHGGSLKKLTIEATGIVLVNDPRASCKPDIE
jgi:hypothetical protein